MNKPDKPDNPNKHDTYEQAIHLFLILVSAVAIIVLILESAFPKSVNASPGIRIEYVNTNWSQVYVWFPILGNSSTAIRMTGQGGVWVHNITNLSPPVNMAFMNGLNTQTPGWEFESFSGIEGSSRIENGQVTPILDPSDNAVDLTGIYTRLDNMHLFLYEVAENKVRLHFWQLAFSSFSAGVLVVLLFATIWGRAT